MFEVVAIVVDWLGPFISLKEVRAAARRDDFKDALYLAVGRKKYDRRKNLQYVGITKRLDQRLHNGRFEGIQDQLGIWIGVIASHAVAGKRRIKRSTSVDLAEWGTAYFLELPLNHHKRKSPPPLPLLIRNRWYSTEYKPRLRRPLRDWADFIEYDGRKGPATIAWLTHPGRNRRLPSSDVLNLRRSD